MGQAVWSGSITFGLVNIPVRLYPATQPKDVRFHLYDRRTGKRVRYERVTRADEAATFAPDPAFAPRSGDSQAESLPATRSARSRSRSARARPRSRRAGRRRGCWCRWAGRARPARRGGGRPARRSGGEARPGAGRSRTRPPGRCTGRGRGGRTRSTPAPARRWRAGRQAGRPRPAGRPRRARGPRRRR